MYLSASLAPVQPGYAEAAGQCRLRNMGERFTPDAMLLAAGLGTRMMPLTSARPKPLIEVGGVALVDRMIAALHAEGLRQFVVNAHHHADQLDAHLDRLRLAWPDSAFRLSREAVLMDTGGGVKSALPLLRTDPILVSNTDAFWLPGSALPIERLLAAHQANPNAAILLCVAPRRALGFRHRHDFHLGQDGHIGTAGPPVIYAGVSLLPRHWLADAPDAVFSLNTVFAAARASELLLGVTLETDWFHVGDPEALAAAEAKLAEPVV
jgi:MurNAc alpha-1-phosphate uridylyltransferase